MPMFSDVVNSYEIRSFYGLINIMSPKKTKKQSITPAPEENTTPLLLRVVVSLLSAILGYNFSRSAFFREYPLFGFRYVGELMSLVLAGTLGYFALPTALMNANRWFEQLVSKAVSEIVSKFWEEQTKKIQEARREKQKEQAKERKEKLKRDLEDALLIDTSVLVDGRILDIVRAGFLSSTLIISQNVIDELHLISDNKDKIKRQRGRRGLDVIKKLKKQVKVISPQIKGKKKGVDKTLVSFAKEHQLTIMTLDYNLSKVADVLGIKVLNINNLVNALKTVLLPGEELEVEIIQEGKEKDQGVGYLSDGTMIVVTGANDKIGKKVDAVVKKVIQSAAGKMIFCDLA
jgi:uncharacterized protein YacL